MNKPNEAARTFLEEQIHNYFHVREAAAALVTCIHEYLAGQAEALLADLVDLRNPKQREWEPTQYSSFAVSYPIRHKRVGAVQIGFEYSAEHPEPWAWVGLGFSEEAEANTFVEKY